MLILELAAQGLKGVSPAGGTLRLRAGYNVVTADGPLVRRLLEGLLRPDAHDGEALRALGAGAQVRAGVTFVGAEGATFRVVRDFAAGCQLQRFDAQRRAFTSVAQGVAELASQLPQVGVPAAAKLRLLTLAAGDLPSRRVAAAPGPATTPPPVPRARTPAQVQTRLEELRRELDRALAAEKLQYRLDGLQSRLFKLEEALKEQARAAEEAAAARGALDAAAAAAAIEARLGDVDARLAGFEKAVARRDEALARISGEKEALEAAARHPPLPFWKDLRFWACAGTGLVAVAAAVLGAGGAPAMRYLALLDIPAFGGAAWVALGWVHRLEAHGRLGRRRRLVEEHERKVQDAFEREAADVKAAMRELGASRLSELREALHRLADLRGAAQAKQSTLEELRRRPESRSAAEEKAQVEAELRQVEGALAGTAGGYVREPRSIEQEIERLEAGAAAPTPVPAVPEAPALDLAEALGSAPAPAADGAPRTDPFQQLLQRAADALGGSPVGAVRPFQARAAQHLQALSSGRLGGLALDDRGLCTVEVSGRPAAVLGLPPVDRDLAYVALEIALLEHALPSGGGVALLEDALAGLPEPARRAAGRLLKQAARGGQIVHLTADVAFRESADHLA